MKCKHCSEEIHAFKADEEFVFRTVIHQPGWAHTKTGSCACHWAEPEETEAQRDLEELRSTLAELPGTGWPATQALYRTIIRLAEKEVG